VAQRPFLCMPQQLCPLPHFRERCNTSTTGRCLIMKPMTKFATGTYAILFIVTLTMLCRTLANYPLFPFQMDSLDWTSAWLITTIVDYYGACLCFCGVVVGTEENLMKGLLWAISFCLLGSPVCCLWMVLHLWRCGGTLRLEKRTRQQYEEH
jgi:hypothetical protein